MSVLAQTGGDSLLRLLVFGGAALGVFALIYVLHRLRKKNTFNITFARLYGLLVLAILVLLSLAVSHALWLSAANGRTCPLAVSSIRHWHRG